MKSNTSQRFMQKMKRELETHANNYVTENINGIKFSIYQETSEETAQAIIATVLYAMSLHGFGQKRLKDVIEWTDAVLQMPKVMGKRANTDHVMKYIKDKYDIDVKDLKINIMSKEEFDAI